MIWAGPCTDLGWFWVGSVSEIDLVMGLSLNLACCLGLDWECARLTRSESGASLGFTEAARLGVDPASAGLGPVLDRGIGMSWAGLGWAGLGWAGLGWAGLGWVGLGWARLGWTYAVWAWAWARPGLTLD